MSDKSSDIVISPKQTFLLKNLSTVDSVLFGGQAGGGKSEGLLAFCLQRRMQYPGSIGLILRRTFPELEKSLLRKARRFFHNCAVPRNEGREWRFHNGSIQEFGYCSSEDDVYQYQSAEYDDICIDEASHFTEFQLLYLQSRLRPRSAPKGLMRLASNPGNIGHNYLKSNYVDVARNVVYTDEHGRTRYFLPASLKDNTMMSEDQRREYALWLSTLPERERKQLEEGDWDYVPGAAFMEIQREKHGIDPANPPERLLRVFDFERMTPRANIKIFRSFDWGYAKPFSLGWYFSDYDNKLYRYRELYGCTSPNKGIEMPARDVAIKIHTIEQEHNERITLSIADASIWDKPSNQNEMAEKLPSIAETMAEEGVWFDREISVNAKKSRLQGKHQLHERFRLDKDGLPHLFVFNTCVHWWRTVPAIPIDRLNPEDVDTNSEDHCLSGDTEVMTDMGVKQLKNIVETNGKILSVNGRFEPYTDCRMTRKNVETVKVVFDDGREVICTPEHKFLTDDYEWFETKDLTGKVIYDSISYLVNQEDGKICKSILLMIQFKSSMGNDITNAASTFRKKANDYIEKFIKKYMEKSLLGLQSIIRMIIGAITSPIISILSAGRPIQAITQGNVELIPIGYELCMKEQGYGIEAVKAKNGIKNTSKRIAGSLLVSRLQLNASNAGKSFRACLNGQNSALTTANQHGGEDRELIALKENVSSVVQSGLLINTWQERLVQPIAVKGNPRVVSVVPHGRSDVYCLSVPSTKCFAVNGGIVVHNCYDESRYLVSSRPMTSRVPQPAVKQYSVNWFYKRSEQPEGVYV